MANQADIVVVGKPLKKKELKRRVRKRTNAERGSWKDVGSEGKHVISGNWNTWGCEPQFITTSEISVQQERSPRNG